MPSTVAKCTFDLNAPPAVLALADVAAGYGQLTVQVVGLQDGDVVQQMAFSAAPTTGAGARITHTIDTTARADGQLTAVALNARAMLGTFAFVPGDIDAFRANATYTYSVRVWLLRAGVSEWRELVRGSITAAPDPSSVTSLLTVGSVTITGTATGAPGATSQLTATVKDSQGNTVAVTPTWASSNINAVSVDANGLLTFVAPGSATISAIAQGVVQTVTATATDPGFTAATAGQIPRLNNAGKWVPASLPFIDVKADAGAKGDGVADDSGAVQNAVTRAQSAGGGVVYFPPGRYLVLSELSITGNNLRFVGAHRLLSTVITTGANATAFAVQGAAVSNLTFQSLGIAGAADSADTNPAYAIFVDAAYSVDELHVLDCEIHDFNAGVFMSNGSRLLVQGTRMYNMRQDSDGLFGYGVECRAVDTVQILGCDLTADRHNIYIGADIDTGLTGPGNNAVVADCVLHGRATIDAYCTGYEAPLHCDGIDDVTVSNVIIRGGIGHATFTDCLRLNIDGLIGRDALVAAANAQAAALWVEDNVRTLLRAHLTDIIIDNPASHGIHLQTAGEVDVVAPQLRAPAALAGKYGLWVNRAANYRVTGGSVSGFDAGIHADTAASIGKVLGVRIENCTTGLFADTNIASLQELGCSLSGNTTDVSSSGAGSKYTYLRLDAATGLWINSGFGGITATSGFRHTLDGWYVDNVPASATASTMVRYSAGTNPRYSQACRDGSITGLVIRANAPITAGTLMVEVYVEGVASGCKVTLTSAGESSGTIARVTASKDAYPFLGGRYIEPRFTTSADFLPTTVDIHVSIEIET